MAKTAATSLAEGDGVAVGRQTPFEPEPAEGPSAFPPIAEYAFLSDCETNALVAPSGNVEWLCSPRPDGRSVFASVLDRAAGGFRLVRVPGDHFFLHQHRRQVTRVLGEWLRARPSGPRPGG